MLMNWICSIPEEIGWVIVGAVGMLCLEMFGLLIGTVVDMIRERMMDDDEEEAF
jgi:hypothetical protein